MTIINPKFFFFPIAGPISILGLQGIFILVKDYNL
jgi:hypothetical protein